LGRKWRATADEDRHYCFAVDSVHSTQTTIGDLFFDVVILFTRVNTGSTNNDSLRCLGAAAKGRLFSAKTERYFYHDDRRPLYLLLVYAKGRQENLTPDKKKAVRKLTALLKQ